MKRAPVLFVLLVLLCLPATAQDVNVQDFEVYAGYSRMTGDLGLNGFELSAAYRPVRAFGVVADGSWHWGSGEVALIDIESTIQNYLFGPRVYLHNLVENEKFVPFAHVLFGFSRQDTDVSGVPTSQDDTAFTWAIGGGFEYMFNERWGGRGKADFLRTNFFDEGDTRARFGFGLAYHFGGRPQP